jgi:glycosyltransferase involved in cell wall biosynthesis
MVANLRPIKAPDVFVRAAGILGPAHPNVTFQIAGDGDEQSVLQLARQSDIQDHFELKGRVNDIPSFLGSLDVAVLTSHSEGLSNALLEYMAAGRPIVATAVGGNVELIEDGTHGLLVPPGNPSALAMAIERLLRNPALAAHLGAAARSRILEHYSTEVAVHNWETLYANVGSVRC